MTQYTFFFHQMDGTALSFESREHPSEVLAFCAATELLKEHASCEYVVAWNDERQLFAVPRTAARRAALGGAR